MTIPSLLCETFQGVLKVNYSSILLRISTADSFLPKSISYRPSVGDNFARSSCQLPPVISQGCYALGCGFVHPATRMAGTSPHTGLVIPESEGESATLEAPHGSPRRTSCSPASVSAFT